MTRLSLIVAVAENGVIGANNALPWRLPTDLKHFRRLTMGHSIIMGRKNYESIGRPLPGRTNIIVTRNRDYHAPGCRIALSVEAALALAGDDSEIFIIGGSKLYAQTLAHANRLYLTRVHASVPGDTYFPTFNTEDWQKISCERHEADTDHAYAYSFIVFNRKQLKL